ncbi:hypothetical protein PsAD37_04307 [Pseudovibrio sp. Ad37]|nr:hypothetical protein PsAD37_04307 [Pseudovibrio sp. Ad37]
MKDEPDYACYWPVRPASKLLRAQLFAFTAKVHFVRRKVVQARNTEGSPWDQ